MSEAELTVMEKAVSASDVRWDELKEAVEAAVEQGRVLMEMQEARSVEEFNDDSEYSKMLQEAVQVRALPPAHIPGSLALPCFASPQLAEVFYCPCQD